MNRQLTPRVMILAASIAGLIACDKSQKVNEAQEDLAQQRQEAAREQAELRREQNQERAEQAREMHEERADQPMVNRPMVPRPTPQEAREEHAEEHAELAREHQEEREDLNRRQSKKLEERRKDLTEAQQELAEERAEIVKDSREKLEQLDKRAAELRTRVEQGSAEDGQKVSSALATFPNQRRAVERDIEALEKVTAANLNRAKENVEKKLSSLDKTLDRAERHD